MALQRLLCLAFAMGCGDRFYDRRSAKAVGVHGFPNYLFLIETFLNVQGPD
jgi:hypothetical protein